MGDKTVLIIGAGIGGLVTAIHLAKRGYAVTILEKNDSPGGRCNQIIKQGHHFDIGPTFLIFPQLYREMFAAFGEDFDQYIQLFRVDPAQQVIFDDHSKLFCSFDLKLMESQLEQMEPGSYPQFIKFLAHTKKLHRLGIEQIIKKDFRHLFEFINYSNVWNLLKVNALENHQHMMSHYFKNPKLQAAFSFQDTYIGLNPATTPAIFALFAYSEFTDGVWLPRGGMQEITSVLEQIAIRNHVKIIYNSQVTKLVPAPHRVTEVIVNDDQIYKPDIIVANADLPYVYTHLLPKSNYQQNINRKKYACSTMTFMWGVKKIFKQLLTHNLFLSDPIDENYHAVVEEQIIPVKPHFYVHAPSRIDTQMAPENEDTITAIVPIGHLGAYDETTLDQQKNNIRDFVIQRLQKFGLNDFSENIKFEIIITPKDWQHRLNLSHGTTLGLHHNIGQLGYFRPKRQHPQLQNLFFVGSNTHPGSGIPTVMLSALFTSRQIIEQSM